MGNIISTKEKNNDSIQRLTAVHAYSMQHTLANCSKYQLIAAHTCSLQHTPVHSNTRLLTAAHACSLQHTLAHCSTRLLTAAHTHVCSLQHTPAHCNTRLLITPNLETNKNRRKILFESAPPEFLMSGTRGQELSYTNWSIVPRITFLFLMSYELSQQSEIFEMLVNHTSHNT